MVGVNVSSVWCVEKRGGSWWLVRGGGFFGEVVGFVGLVGLVGPMRLIVSINLVVGDGFAEIG